jgi:hypothetical protein
MGMFVLFGLAITFLASPYAAPPPLSALGGEAEKSLRAFGSEAEFNAWFQAKKAAYNAVARRSLMQDAAAPAAAEGSETKSITNTQSAGVDEGGIVKLHKNHLVILRRGRLFTVKIGDGALDPVDMRDAFAPGSDGRGAWYDELLISGDAVIVIGYSYAKGGTELTLFRIGEDGRLAYQSTYVLRANDYYSSRNYASRLIGDTLIFYAPLYLHFGADPAQSLPALRRWQDTKNPGEFQQIVPATRIYRAADDLDPNDGVIALHSVTTCRIADGALNCAASAVLGHAGREFYVARNAVYVWSAPWHYGHGDAKKEPVGASLFRLPLNSEAAPTALKVFGSPIDQFSFLESEDAHLNVLLRADGPLASMWAAEEADPDRQELAFLRVPLAVFGDGSTSAAAARENYTPLPAPENGGSLQNRYIGDALVYGAGQTWWGRKGQAVPSAAYVFHWKSKPVEKWAYAPLQKVPLPHSVDRIEALGETPLLVGTQGGDLYFTPLLVASPHASGLTSEAGDSFKLPNAAQGETRSHGFFYKPDAAGGGLLGLPFAGSGRQGWRQLQQTSSGVVFLRYTRPDANSRFGKLARLGILTATDKKTNDRCIASCADWYGNSRPLFIANRLFALMGYEIAEGVEDQGENQRIREVRRVDFYRQLAKES